MPELFSSTGFKIAKAPAEGWNLASNEFLKPVLIQFMIFESS